MVTPPEIAVFEAYIAIFAVEMSFIRLRTFPELIPSIPLHDFPPFGPYAQKGFHISTFFLLGS
jgi:hypothetical protein